MRKTIILLLILILMLAACDLSQDQESADREEARHYTIGLVIPHEVTIQIFDQYRVQMAELGYEEGQNVTYIQKGPSTNLVELLSYPRELVEENVDLLIVVASEGALLAQSATEDTPIVFIAGDTPVEMGLAETLERPGGNITGVMTTGPEARRLEILLEIVPTIERLYVPYNPSDVMADKSLEELVQAAADMEIELVLQEMEDEAEIEQAQRDLPEDIDGIFLLQDVLVSSALEQWGILAVEHQLPLTAAGVGTDGTSGYTISPLMGYGLYVPDIAGKAARLSDQILQGANPGDLPIETAELYLTVNLDTAEAIGIEVPDHILEQAQFVRNDVP